MKKPSGSARSCTQTRFAKFADVPELVSMFRAVADVRTIDQLGLSIPAVTGGRAETVVVAASERLERNVRSLVERAERIRNRAVSPDEDMMLKVCDDARNAALDLRVVGELPDPDGGKIAAAADRIAVFWRANADRAYLGERGQAEPCRGALQLVFCDLSVSRAGWITSSPLRSATCTLWGSPTTPSPRSSTCQGRSRRAGEAALGDDSLGGRVVS